MEPAMESSTRTDYEAPPRADSSATEGDARRRARNQVNSMLADVKGKQARRKARKENPKPGQLERLQIEEAEQQQGQAEVEEGEMKVPCQGRTAVYHVGEKGLVAPKESMSWLPPHTARKHRNKHRHLHMSQAPAVGMAISLRDLDIDRDVVGRGAQGVVRKARHKATGTLFAVKEIQVIPQQGTEVTVKHLQRELERCCLPKASCACDCLVQSYEAYFSERKNSISILMEWMDFGSLSDILSILAIPSSSGSLGDSADSILSPVVLSPAVTASSATHEIPQASAARREPGDRSVSTVELNMGVGRMCTEDVALVAYYGLVGLVQLRELGQIHNDIKPGNLLINREGKLKIGDFGVAQWTDSISMARSNSTGSQLFMAPERIRGDQFTYAADVYSLGLTVANCAMGQYPLAGKGGSLYFLLAGVAQGNARVEFPPELGADDDLQRFVWECMHPHWEKRPTAKELLEHPFVVKYGADPESRPFRFLSLLERGGAGQPDGAGFVGRERSSVSSSPRFPEMGSTGGNSNFRLSKEA
eukprot:Hpha_TRINITY_DN15226_c0_g12::TRINITY_DN15226_c0_g12_i1::g.65528::m.65528